MRKILLLIVLITGAFNHLSAQGKWVSLSDNWTTDAENYTINAVSFDFPYPNYGAIFTENKETGKGVIFYYMGTLNSTNKVYTEYQGGITGYAQYGDYVYPFGKSGTLSVSQGAPYSWSNVPLPDELNQINFTAGAFVPASSGYYLNFTGVLTDGSNLYYSICDETNRTQNWGTASIDNPINEIKDIKYNEYDGKFYAVGTEGQIFSSEDNGQNWNLVQTNLNPEVTITSLAFVNTGEENSMLLVGYLTEGDPLVYKTTDFNEFSSIQSFADAGNFNKFVYSSEEDAYYLLSKKGMIIKSVSNGNNWETIRESQDQDNIYNDITILPGMESFAIYVGGENGLLEVYVPDMTTDFEIIPTDKANVFDFQSNSSGLISNYRWEFEEALFPYDGNNPKQAGVFFNTSGTKTITLTTILSLPIGDITKEVTKTINVVTDFDWQLLNSGGYTNNDIVFPGNQNKIGYIAQQVNSDNETGKNGVLKTTNGGKDWIEVLTTTTQTTNDKEETIIGPAYALSFPTVTTGYVCTQGIQTSTPEIWKTTDGGENWQKLELPADLDIQSPSYFHTIHFWNENQGIVFHNDIVMVTSDGGKNWIISMITEVGQEQGSQQTTRFNLGSKYAVASENTLYGISSVNTIRQGPNTISSADIYKSEDKGANWIKISTIDTDGLLTGARINISFSDEENGVVVGSSSTSTQFSYITTDGGITWETHAMTADNIVTSLHHANDTLLFAAGNSQLLMRSEDGGATWTNENQPLNNGKTLSNLINFTSTSTGAVFAIGDNGVIKRYSPELKADFEIIANEDSTYVTFKNNSIGFITDFKWEVNGTIESEDFVIEELELIRPNSYRITLTVSAEGYGESSLTKEFVMTGCNPEKSIDPSPADEGQLEVWENITLSWKNETCEEGGDITYTVHFGTSETDLTQLATDLTEASYKIDKKLEQKTVYYWSIDATNDYSTIQGDVWSFTTGKETNAIEKNPADKEISISPNPFNDYFIIYVNNKTVEQIEVQLTDLQGRIVYSQVFTGNETITVNNLAGISSGVYVCTVKADNTVSVQKIVKQ